MPKVEYPETTIVVFVSQKIKTLYPITDKRPVALQIIAGKRIIEWHHILTKKFGATKLLLLCDKNDRKLMYEYLDNYVETSAPDNEIGPFTIIDYDSEKGISSDLITRLVSNYLTKYSIWLDSNVIFSQKFYKKFIDKAFGSGKYALISHDQNGDFKESLGIGFFDLKFLEQSLEKAKNVNDIYSLIRKRVASGTSGMEYTDDMHFWQIKYPWEVLDANQELIKSITGKISGKIEKGATILGEVVIGKGARIRAGSYLEGPLVVGEDCDIGPNCFLRKGVSLGKKVRIGNGCELKNTVVDFDTHIAHLSYVGDSIIGEKCNFGAGTITGNLRIDDQMIKSQVDSDVVSTGRRKIGPFISN